MSSLRKKALNGMRWSLLGTVGNSILQTVVMVVVTRLIMPEEFGVFAIAQLFVQFAAFFADFGVGTALLRRKELTENHISAGFWSAVWVATLIAGIMFFLAPYSMNLLESPKIVSVVRFLSLNFLINGAGVVSMTLLQREMRFGVLAIINILGYGIGYGMIGIPLATQGYGVYALVACMLFQSVFRVLSLYAIVRHRLRPSFCKRTYSEILLFGGQNSVAGLLSFLGNSCDKFMLGHRGDAGLLGIYSRSGQLINHPIQSFSGSIVRVLLPGFSQVQKDRRRMRLMYQKSLAGIALVFIPISCFASVVGKDLITIAFGDTWEMGWPAFVSYAWVSSISLLGMIGLMVNDIIGRQVYRMRIQTEALILFLVMIGWGVRYGILGVAAMVLVGHVFRLILITHLIQGQLKMKSRDVLKIYVWPFFLGGVVCLVPGILLVLGGGFSEITRLLISVVGSLCSVVLLANRIYIPPLVEILEIIDEEYPKLAVLGCWVRRDGRLVCS